MFLEPSRRSASSSRWASPCCTPLSSRRIRSGTGRGRGRSSSSTSQERQVLIGGTRLRGRDQEVDLQRDELPAAQAGGAVHALLGEHGQGRGRGVLLRPVGHGEDHAVGTTPSRMFIGDDEHGWSADGVFNFEGGNYAKVIRLSGGRAAHLGGEHPLRRHPGERGAGRGPRSGFRRRLHHREHTLVLPAPLHRRGGGDKRGGHPRTIVFPDRRRVRCAASHRQAEPGPGDVPLPGRLHGQGGGDRARGDGAQGHVQRLLRRPVPAAPPARYAELLAG
jgi:hypothetical protein